MQVKRQLLHALFWLLAAVCATALTLAFLAPFALVSYDIEHSLSTVVPGSVASAVVDAAFYAVLVLIWAVAGLLGGHLTTSQRLWPLESKAGYWWAATAALAVAGAFVAMEMAPLAAVAVTIGTHFGRKSGLNAHARDESIRGAIQAELR